jgi:hypothetical protein
MLIRAHRSLIDSERGQFESGAEGARTPDLRAASATLSQLSYSPLLGFKVIAGVCLQPNAAINGSRRSSSETNSSRSAPTA